MRHAHARTLVAPTVIGHTRNGTPVWSIAGGAEDDQTDDTSTDDTDDQSDDSADDDTDADDEDKQLGPAGEKALREMKKRAREAERELRRLKAEAEKPKPEDKDDAPDADAIRQEVEGEVRQQYARDRALDKLEAKAARKFQNPDLARKLLADQADDFLDEKGNPDVEAITEALEELLTDEPYLAVQDGKRFQGDADGGTRNGSKPAQLSRADLAGMSPEQINKAKAEGRLDVLLGRT